MAHMERAGDIRRGNNDTKPVEIGKVFIRMKIALLLPPSVPSLLYPAGIIGFVKTGCLHSEFILHGWKTEGKPNDTLTIHGSQCINRALLNRKFLREGEIMPRGREIDRELRRKYGKKERRQKASLKAMKVAQAASSGKAKK